MTLRKDAITAVPVSGFAPQELAARSNALPSGLDRKIGQSIRYTNVSVSIPNAPIDDETRNEILGALYAERSDLQRKSRISSLSDTDEEMLSHTNRAIERLQRAQVEQMRATDDMLWQRVEAAVGAMNLLPTKK
jgi:hypothetical protein